MKGYLRQFEICARFEICDQTWINWRKRAPRAGEIPVPQPVPLPGARKWRVEDIEAFEQALVRQPGRSFFSSHRRAG